jgi:hypothetical protein
VQFGTHNLTLGTPDNPTPVCLTPEDMSTRRRFALYYVETNIHPEALIAIGPFYRNQILFNGASVAVSEARPELPLGATRSVKWEGDVPLTPNRRANRLDLVLDSEQIGGLIPLSEVWQLQPEVYDNNTYSLEVTFCGFKPNLTPGPTLYLGGQAYLWGTTVCLPQTALRQYVENRGENKYIRYGLDFIYTEVNEGLDQVRA